MKNFATIPFHDEITETFTVGNRRDEVGIFEVRINNGHFSENCMFQKNDGELASIRATAYKEDSWKRVFMYLKHRCPTWAEMAELSDMFFEPEEIAIQFHPCLKQYVNENSTALHLWEPKDKGQLKNLKIAGEIVKSTTEKLRTISKNNEVILGKEKGKSFVAIFCSDNWLTWEEVCSIKQKYFGINKTAFQLNFSKEFDLNSSKVMTLWDADEFGIKLPPREIV